MYVPAPGRRYPALLAACWVAVGIVCGDCTDGSATGWLIAAAFLLSCALIPTRIYPARLRWLQAILIGVLLLSVGAWRLTSENQSRPAPLLIELAESNSRVEVFGRLAGLPQQRSAGWRAPFEIQAVRHGNTLQSLHVNCQLFSKTDLGRFHYGDNLRFVTHLRIPAVRRNPGGFDYANHLFRRGIDCTARPAGPIQKAAGSPVMGSLGELVEPLRIWMRKTYGEYLSPVPRALILGFLLGDTDQLDPSVHRAFRESGTLHLLAVSGANVWLVAGMVLLPLRLLRVTRLPRTIVLLVVIVLFCSLTRNEPSVVRASLTAATILVGQLTFRSASPLNSVGVAGLIILLISPNHLFRPGFQLSFAAVVAIVIVAQRSARPINSRQAWWMRWVISLVLSSLAAALVTAPIIAWHFGTVPMIAPLSNLLMIPLASSALYSGIGLLAMSAIIPEYAGVVALPAEWLLRGCATLAKLMAGIPSTQFLWSQPSWLTIANFYLCGILLLNWQHRYRWGRPVVYYLVATILCIGAARLIAPRTPGVGLTVLDAGVHLAVAVEHRSGELSWILDSAAVVDDDLRYWVLESFARARAATVIESELTNLIDSVDLHGVDAPRHLIERSPAVPDDRTADQWTEQFMFRGDTVVLFRTCRDGSPLRTSDPIPPLSSGGQVRVIPARLLHPEIRRILDSTTPHGSVIFYGRPYSNDQPDQWLATWKARYPTMNLWSTAVHGGISIRWNASGLLIAPTIANDIWRDSEYR